MNDKTTVKDIIYGIILSLSCHYWLLVWLVHSYTLLN